MSESISLTDVQLEIMRVLWRMQEATVNEVHRELVKERELAPPTVATMLSRLEKKGAVTHRTEGRQFVYAPAITESETRRTMTSHLADRVFGGNVPSLIHQLLSERDISPAAIAEVKAILAAREEELAKKRRK